jgi:hypothetical protein
MTQNRLEGLLLMFVEQDLLAKIQYAAIIEEFKNIIPFNFCFIL